MVEKQDELIGILHFVLFLFQKPLAKQIIFELRDTEVTDEFPKFTARKEKEPVDPVLFHSLRL